MWRVADYQFELAQELIAQVPADRRDASRLLVVGPDRLDDRRFGEIASLLPDRAVLVVNDTRVIPARLAARKPSGGAVEIFLLEPIDPDRPAGPWLALGRASKPLRAGLELEVLDRSGQPVLRARLLEGSRDDGTSGNQLRSDRAGPLRGTLVVELDAPALEVAERFGSVPLPPYIRRAVAERSSGTPAGYIQREPGGDAADRERYQTVYAEAPGAVAAPTAGLHFTPELLAALESRGVAIAPLTLHVGLGTFAPVRGDSLRDHRMHRERFAIPDATAALVASGRPLVAVGTTCVRALEAAATGPREVRPGPGSTDLFIGPGHRFQVVDHLITNFHLPGSTLLVLVSAFAGHERVMTAYRHAAAARYRFFSYGDAMLLSRAC